EAFRRAVQLDPQNIGYRIDLAEMLIQTGKAAEAETLYRQTLQLAPHNPDVLAHLGGLLAEQTAGPERIREAHDLLQRALGAKPGDPYTLYALGRLALTARDGNRAARYLKSA